MNFTASYHKDRKNLSMATQEAFTHLAQSLVMYLDIHSPEGLRDVGIDSSGALVDFMSKVSFMHCLLWPQLDAASLRVIHLL
jgi:hypothetical protein